MRFMDPLEMAIVDVNSEWVGVSRKQLMENAGSQVSSFILDRVLPDFDVSSEKKVNVVVFSGTGGNGGDGFVASRHLSSDSRVQKPISVFLVGDEQRIRLRITKENWETLKRMIFSIKVKTLKSSSDIESLDFTKNSSPVIIIDALLGTGVKGKLREPTRSAIYKINEWKKKEPRKIRVVSVDVPSGMNPATGAIEDLAVEADWIIALHTPKKGLQRVPHEKLITVDIGIPPDAERACGPGHVQILSPRAPWSHKGDHGRLWIIGGSKLYSGAPILSAMAAQQVGIDLVTIFAPESVASVIRSFSPNFIVHPLEGDMITWESIRKGIFVDQLSKKKPDVVLIGPGSGADEDTLHAIQELIMMLLKEGIPMIIDADALKVINRFEKLGPQVVLTPHAGEFKLITGDSLPSGDAFISERIALVRKAVERFNSIFIVKGRWDVICGPITSNGGTFHIEWRLNATGTPAMTVGGTGDVLAGTVAGLTALTKKLFHSACLGTFLVGRSGELAASRKPIIKATDVIEFLPEVLKDSWLFVKNS